MDPAPFFSALPGAHAAPGFGVVPCHFQRVPGDFPLEDAGLLLDLGKTVEPLVDVGFFLESCSIHDAPGKGVVVFAPRGSQRGVGVCDVVEPLPGEGFTENFFAGVYELAVVHDAQQEAFAGAPYHGSDAAFPLDPAAGVGVAGLSEVHFPADELAAAFFLLYFRVPAVPVRDDVWDEVFVGDAGLTGSHAGPVAVELDDAQLFFLFFTRGVVPFVGVCAFHFFQGCAYLLGSLGDAFRRGIHPGEHGAHGPVARGFHFAAGGLFASRFFG